MIKREMKIKVEEIDVINFCRLLGARGITFDISEVRTTMSPYNMSRILCYRIFRVRASDRCLIDLLEEFRMTCRGCWDF